MHQHLSNSYSKFLNYAAAVLVGVFLLLFVKNVNLDYAVVNNTNGLSDSNVEVTYNNEILSVDSGNFNLGKGDKVILKEAGDFIYVSEINKLFELKILLVIFCAFILYIFKMNGFRVVLSLIGSIFVISYFTLPFIASGYSPILICLISSFLLVPVTFYLTHGFNKKTNIAVLSTLISIGFSSIVILLAMKYLNLSGLSSEESNFLLFNGNLNLDFQGILFGGILISLLGILDDITISQTSLTLEIQKANPKQSKKLLFKRAMEVGKDHIASLTNTIFLIYAGASLPLLLLFNVNAQEISSILNNETFIEEIVRSLIGSFSLIIAVFVSTYLACLNKNK